VTAGYDPHRVSGLGVRTRSALGDLDAITSDDAAAAGALEAVQRLRLVLATGFAPTVAAVRTSDPLGAGSNWYDNWLSEQLGRIERTRYSDVSDVDLATFLRIELTKRMEENGAPDPDDPFWTGEFPEWVDEFERRARIDPDFAAFLADEAGRNPMIGYVVAAGNCDADVLIAVATALIESDSGGAIYDTYRDGAIAELLVTISEQADVALTLLGEPDMVETLLTWNDRDAGAFGLDGEAIGELFASALGFAITDPSRMGEGQDILRQLVALTHGPLFDRGLPPGTGAGITTGVIGYIPLLIGSVGLDHNVYFHDTNGVFTSLLGPPAAVVDLFGALLRDPTSRAMLIATIPALAIGTGGVAVNDYVNLLIEAAGTEQIEEEIYARRTRDQWNQVIEFVSSLLEAAFKVGGKKFAVAKEAVRFVEKGARWLVKQIDASNLGLDDVQTTGFLLLIFGVAVAFLDQRPDDSDDDREDQARDLADEIERLLDDGAPHSEVERQILNLRELVEEIGGDDALASLNDPRIAPAAYDDATDAELAD